MESILKPNRITILSKSYCPFCVNTKNTLKKLGLDFTVYEVDLNELDQNIVSQIQKYSNHKTFPNIFFGKQAIGGDSALRKIIQQKTLKQLLDKNNIEYTAKL